MERSVRVKQCTPPGIGFPYAPGKGFCPQVTTPDQIFSLIGTDLGDRFHFTTNFRNL